MIEGVVTDWSTYAAVCWLADLGILLRWPFSNHQVDPLGRDELLHRFDESLRTAADGIARTLRTS
ncbi:MAG: hypothetical protein DMF90_23680 [Acidobacteria bacterium]|nr:MAG: hypothetical protein DMF90_23680 [Acidobacteriota bacterium]